MSVVMFSLIMFCCTAPTAWAMATLVFVTRDILQGVFIWDILQGCHPADMALCLLLFLCALLCEGLQSWPILAGDWSRSRGFGFVLCVSFMSVIMLFSRMELMPRSAWSKKKLSAHCTGESSGMFFFFVCFCFWAG